MCTIALLTDFGARDSYAGVMKGVILSFNPRINIVDITHEVEPGAIQEAAFLLEGAYRYFPEGTIFLVVVDPGVGSARRGICIKTKHYYFVGPDNGVLSWAAEDDEIKMVYSLERKKFFLTGISSTFHGRDVFAPVAAHISLGVKINSFGHRVKRIKRLARTSPVVRGGVLEGIIVYVDRFGNLVTNISASLLRDFLGGSPFRARIKRKEFSLIHDYYEQSSSGEPFFIAGGFSLMEVSIRGGSAAGYFKAKSGDRVLVRRKKI